MAKRKHVEEAERVWRVIETMREREGVTWTELAKRIDVSSHNLLTRHSKKVNIGSASLLRIMDELGYELVARKKGEVV